MRARLGAGLAAVNALIDERVSHDDPFIAGANRHLAEAGGKRFRPLLTLLAGELGSGVNDQVVAAAAGVELTHLASLYHDDVMDEADVRRGTPSAMSRSRVAAVTLVASMTTCSASSITAMSASLRPASARFRTMSATGSPKRSASTPPWARLQ